MTLVKQSLDNVQRAGLKRRKFLVGAGVMLVTACVQQAALRTQEALLRLEYRIAEMAETRTASDRP